MATMDNALVVANYFKQPGIVKRFAEVLGGEVRAKPYIQSVLVAVSSSLELQQCTPESILRGALRAATLELSCDPALRQAHLVPYNRKTDSGWIKEAQFQPHYNGLYTLAMRTGKYWVINVGPVYEGQEVVEHIQTGLHYIRHENGLIMSQDQGGTGMYRTVTKHSGQKIIGWLGYFKTTKGFEKTVYMDIEEIETHAQKYSKAYQKDLEKGWHNSQWSDPERRETMEMKTVLLALLRWADLSGNESALLRDAMQVELNDEMIDVEAEIATVEENELPIQQNVESKAAPRETDAPAFTAQVLVNEGIVPEKPHAEAMMKLLLISDGADYGESMQRVKLYMQWRKIYAKNTPHDRDLAAEKAIAGEVPD